MAMCQAQGQIERSSMPLILQWWRS